MPITLTPQADVPMPTDAFSPITYRNQKDQVACAITALEELIKRGATVGEDGEIELKEENKQEALQVFTEHTENKKHIPQSSLNKPGVLLFLNTVLQDYDKRVVKNAEQVRTYVTNRLLEKSNSEDEKTQLKALELLGKITEVGLFTDKHETVVKHGTTEELENALKNKLGRLIELSKEEYKEE